MNQTVALYTLILHNNYILIELEKKNQEQKMLLKSQIVITFKKKNKTKHF